MVEKHLEHQYELFLNYVDFNKALGRIWLDVFWRFLKEQDIDNRLAEVT